MHDEVLLLGELGVGADGTTLLLSMASPSAAQWLQSKFRALSEGAGPVILTDNPGVRIRGLGSLELRGSDDRKYFARSFFLTGDSAIWVCGSERWTALAELLDPFVLGKTGHQYVTDAPDDATIIVSFGEYTEVGDGLRLGT